MGCGECPRCFESSLEIFKTHNYCANCNYSTTTESKILNLKITKAKNVETEKLNEWAKLHSFKTKF